MYMIKSIVSVQDGGGAGDYRTVRISIPKEISRLADLKKGDFVAWKYDGGVMTIEKVG